LWEAFEEDAHPPPSDVQTGQSIRFSKRRWHMVLLLMAFAFGVLVGAGISHFSW
jgi:hypothetical protein